MTPRVWAGDREEVAGGREILLYLIIYRKYVRKRNKIICPEIAVNGKFLPGKWKLF